MKFPTLAYPEQPVKAWVCVVNAGSQGVVKHEHVTEIFSLLDQVEGGQIQVRTTDKVWIYNLDDIWGAWLDWPHIDVRHKHGNMRRGPEYFLEFKWKPWNWIDKNGAKVVKVMPSRVENSIWCDGSDTDSDPMTTDVFSAERKLIRNGWIRKDRVVKQKRVSNLKYPFMP